MLFFPENMYQVKIMAKRKPHELAMIDQRIIEGMMSLHGREITLGELHHITGIHAQTIAQRAKHLMDEMRIVMTRSVAVGKLNYRYYALPLMQRYADCPLWLHWAGYLVHPINVKPRNIEGSWE